MRVCGYMVASVLDQKKNIPASFIFPLRKSAFPIGLAFFHISTKKKYRRFLKEIGGNNSFSWEKSGGQPQFLKEVQL